MRRGLDGFAGEAEKQLRYFETRNIPVYARVLRDVARLAETDPSVRGALERAWGKREFSVEYERPLLLLAAIRHDALADPRHPLARALAVEPNASDIEDDALRDALAPGRTAIESLETRFVQTNEVTRAIAWRLPLGRWENEAGIALVDLGCSAALNLVADRLALTWTDDTGKAIALARTSGVCTRIGLDRAPIDARDPKERAWLRACLWPGQSERHARLQDALTEAARAVENGEIDLVRVDANEMPDRLEEIAHRARYLLAFQTIFVEYLTGAERAEYEQKMRAFVHRHADRALWAELERAPEGQPGPAQLRLTTARGSRVLASCEFHPTSLKRFGP